MTEEERQEQEPQEEEKQDKEKKQNPIPWSWVLLGSSAIAAMLVSEQNHPPFYALAPVLAAIAGAIWVGLDMKWLKVGNEKLRWNAKKSGDEEE